MSLTRLSVRTPAKINWVLEVLGKRPDQFHELALVFQTVSLYDTLAFERRGSKVELYLQDPPGPLETGDSNLIVRAARLFLEEGLKRRDGVAITLKKDIPLAAGLGGGSSDAAATLVAMDRLFETGLSREVLAEWGSRLGSDVPFFLWGGTALGQDRGEKITPWDVKPSFHLVLAKPSQGLSTPSVYLSGRAAFSDGQKARGFLPQLRQGNARELGPSLYNGLEPAVFFLRRDVERLKEKFLQAGALGALVSGSGPTVFGLCEDEAKARALARRVQESGITTHIASTVPTGVEFLE